MIEVPESFRALIAGRAAEPDVGGDDWLAELPRLVDEMCRRWGLAPDGPVWHGQCAVVLPVGDAVLKLTWPHAEARHEHLALRAWDGDGAVRLLRADPAHWAFLLERLDRTDLRSTDVLEGCEVIGGLVRRLDRPALPPVDRLSDRAERWERLCREGSPRVPRRFTDRAAALLRDLAQDDGLDSRLVHEDLHFENVLAAGRAPWVAIDPKPVSGRWEFAVAPVLWNRPDLTADAYNARAHLRLRLGIVCDAAGLDEDLAAAWSFVRVVVNALWGADDPDWVTRMITVAKAVTD